MVSSVQCPVSSVLCPVSCVLCPGTHLPWIYIEQRGPGRGPHRAGDGLDHLTEGGGILDSPEVLTSVSTPSEKLGTHSIIFAMVPVSELIQIDKQNKQTRGLLNSHVATN